MMIDGMLLQFDMTRREDYGLFLNIHYSTLRDLRAGWRDEDHDDFLVMAHCLQEDLDALGIAATALNPTTRAPLTAGNRFGVAYIIRGSRLDSIVMRHRVPMRFAASYLGFSPALSWTKFLQQLESCISKNQEWGQSQRIIAEITCGARLTLSIFASELTQALA